MNLPRLLRLAALLAALAAFGGAWASPSATLAPRPALPQDEPPLMTIPKGCGSVTLPNTPPAICCVSGFVYLDGRPVAGAEVMVQSASGSATAEPTRVYSDSAVPAHFRIRLDEAPLHVAPGQTITITARYGGYTRSAQLVALPDGQQHDLALQTGDGGGYAFDGEVAMPAPLGALSGVALAADGTLYVVGSSAARVLAFASDGSPLGQWGEPGSQPGQLQRPSGIALDGAGNLIVADTNNHRVQRFSPAGQLLGGWGTQGAALGQFNSPWGVAVDAVGNVYVADRDNNRIQKLAPDGGPLAAWGSLGSAPGQFNGPTGVAVDAVGNVYVADSDNNRIQKLAPDGSPLSAWGSLGSAPGQLSAPWGIAVAGDAVYVTDSGNARVQQWSLAGELRASWGAAGAAPGSFVTPYGVAAHGAAVVVADSGNARVQRFRPISDIRPIATIAQPPERVLAPGAQLLISGMGQASVVGATITAFRWHSDRQGDLGSTPTLALAARSLLPGDHRLFLQVRDSAGRWSAPVGTGFTVDSEGRHTLLLPLVAR
jgi:sugar lactone lactonase YvrE